MSALIAERVLDRAKSRSARMVVDYDHQTLRAAENGQPAPAAGRIDRQSLRYEAGLGILGVIDWTSRAQAMISSGEYAYLSPVFPYDSQTGEVLALLHVALTNDPGLDGLEVAALAASYDFSTEEEPHMTLLQKLLASLGLADTTGEEAALSAVASLKAKAAEADGLTAKVATLTAQVAAPDPAKYVPIATLTAVQAENATLATDLKQFKEAQQTAALNAEIARGEKLNKISPAMKEWAIDLGKSNLASLTAFIDKAPEIVPGAMQSEGMGRGGKLFDMNNASAIAALAAQYQGEQAAKGITITTVQAVAHVTKQQGA